MLLFPKQNVVISGPNRRAQSEVIGIILLTAVVVILAMLVGGTILESGDTQGDPSANLEVTIDDVNVTIGHHGGATLPAGEVTVQLRSTTTQQYSIDSFHAQQGNDGNPFEPGDLLTHEHNAGNTVRVLVIHDRTNTVLYDRAFDVPSSTGENQPPNADFTSSPSPALLGNSITFDASSSTDSDGSVETYEWDLDDDGTTDATGVSAVHSYEEPGEYSVTLEVTDNDGATDQMTQTVRVVTAPSSTFTADCSGMTCTFDASDSRGEIEEYIWEFGGGNSTTTFDPTVEHTYVDEESYDVTLTVQSGNLTDETTRTVTADVTPPDISTFTATDKGEWDREGFELRWIEQYDISWDVDDPTLETTTVYVNRSGTAVEQYDGPTSFETYSRTSGILGFITEYQIKIVAQDAAGNRACEVVSDSSDGTGPDSTDYGGC